MVHHKYGHSVHITDVLRHHLLIVNTQIYRNIMIDKKFVMGRSALKKAITSVAMVCISVSTSTLCFILYYLTLPPVDPPIGRAQFSKL